jgi:hypothetical protein
MASDAKKLFDQVDFDLKVDEDKVPEKSELAFRYFYYLNKSSRIISDTKALNALNFLLTHSENSQIDKIIEFGVRFEVHKILISLLENIYQRLIKILTAVQDVNNEAAGAEVPNKVAALVVGVLAINLAESYASKSSKFCKKFQLENGVKILFNILNNRKIQESIVHSIRHKTGQDTILFKNMFRSIVFSLSHLAKFSLDFLAKWKECQAVKNFLFYLEKTMDVREIRINICLCISYVTGEHDLDLDHGQQKGRESRLKDILDPLTRMVGIASKKIKNNIELERASSVEVDVTTSSVSKSSCLINYKEHRWDLVSILVGLFNLCRASTVRYLIYYEFKASKYLRDLIYFGNEHEVDFSLLLLWQLCFEPIINNNVSRDVELTRFLTNLANSPAASASVKKNASGILFSAKLNEKANVKKDRHHLMFICEKESQEMCQKIKNELQKLKYPVSTVDSSTSSLASVSETIDSSICVLPL